MTPVILQMIIMLHAAFGCVYLFMNRQHPAKFSRLIAQSWLLEAFRTAIVLSQLNFSGKISHWHSLSDCLNLVVTWWLFAGCAELAGIRIPPRLGRYCLGIGIPVIMFLRYLGPAVLEAAGMPVERTGFYSVFIELVVINVFVTLARAAILFWFIKLWRDTRLPGAMLAIIFGVPYVGFAFAVPVQFFYSYYPEWIYLAWAARVLGFSLGLVMLVFDRQRAEQHERDRAYHTIVRTSRDLIWSVDPEGRWTFVNDAARSIYGYEPAEMVGRHFTDFVMPAQAGRALDDHERVKRGESLFNYDTVHRRKDGTPVRLSFNAVVLRDERGRLLGTTGTAQDTTERIRLEEQLRQAQKMEAIGQLAGGVAHDFNNLLTAIIGHLGLLRTNEKVTPDMAESLAEITHAADRAANLTSQLLAFSRRQVIQMQPLELQEVVTHLTKLLRRLLGEPIAVQLDLAAEPLVFNGDAGMMEQVLVNLAVNARDAMPGGGTLRIATGSETRIGRKVEAQTKPVQPAVYVYLEVSDTGAGIAPEVLPRIFDPFFTTKEVGRGTGLGLATVFGIVQQHGGWIEVESEMGSGTRFRVYLPRVEAKPGGRAVAGPPLAGRGQGEVILFVEDEPAVREIGLRALRRQGYRVLEADNGRSALEVWAQHRAEIELVVTDVIMPGGISGVQLGRQLQEEKPGLPIIYTSGYNREIAGQDLAVEEGLNYLAKPYDLEKLFNAVRKALDRGRSGLELA
jgi:PAS domain S-box-containing protein